MDIPPFTWWTICISFSSIFLIMVGVYLYVTSRPKRKTGAKKSETRLRVEKDFAFIWVLLGLLVFYICAIQLGSGTMSEEIFAAGNIIVEALLILYILKNKTERPRQE